MIEDSIFEAPTVAPRVNAHDVDPLNERLHMALACGHRVSFDVDVLRLFQKVPAVMLCDDCTERARTDAYYANF